MKYLAGMDSLISKHKLAVVGCSSEDIEQLEHEIGVVFPEAYTEFLKIAGHNAAGFMSGFDLEARYLFGIQKEAAEIMSRNNEPPFGKTCLVFCIHENYSFYAFKLDNNQNPEVYLFVDGDEGFEAWEKCGTLSFFINNNFISQLEKKLLIKK